MISVQHLTKTFGAEIVLDDISIDFHPSTIYGLVEPTDAARRR
jgi:ABC-type uncharacterized transport system ATPase subunit